jgi:hypothetical protein
MGPNLLFRTIRIKGWGQLPDHSVTHHVFPHHFEQEEYVSSKKSSPLAQPTFGVIDARQMDTLQSPELFWHENYPYGK